VGSQSLTAVYSGDSNYATSTGSATLQVNYATSSSLTTVAVSPATPVVGQTTTITDVITATGTTTGPTGTVNFTAGGTTISGCGAVATVFYASTQTKATCTTTALATAGSNALQAILTPSGNYAASTASTSVTVTAASTVTTLSPTPAAGTWALSDTGGSTAADSSGNSNTGTVQTGVTEGSTAPPGGTASMLFNGTSGYVSLGTSNTLSPTGNFTISAWVKPTGTPTSGQIAAVYARDDSTLGRWGLFGIHNNGSNVWTPYSEYGGTAGSKDGSITIPTTSWSQITWSYNAANTTMYVYVNGVLETGGTQSTATTFASGQTGQTTIGERTYSTTHSYFPGNIANVSIAPTTATAGASTTFTATIVPQYAGAPTGTVNFKNGSSSISGCSAQAVSTTSGITTATCTTTSLGTVGNDAITAVYSGDSGFNTSTSAVANEAIAKAASSTSLTYSPSSPAVNQSITITATVTGPAVTPTGSINFKSNGTTISGCGTQALNAGSPDTATCTTSYATASSPALTAVYTGDGNYTTSTSSAVTPTIVAASTTTTVTDGGGGLPQYNNNDTFTATITPAYGGTTAGTVGFKLDGTNYTGCTTVGVSSNIAQCTMTTAGGLTVGAHTAVATFTATGGNFTSSTSTTYNFTVVGQASTTTITANPSSPAVGQSVTLSSTTTSPGLTVSGTMNFQLGGVSITGCSSQTVTAGAATCTTVLTTSGTASLSAIYSGSSTVATSTGTLSPTVVADPTVTNLAGTTSDNSANINGTGTGITGAMTTQGSWNPATTSSVENTSLIATFYMPSTSNHGALIKDGTAAGGGIALGVGASGAMGTNGDYLLVSYDGSGTRTINASSTVSVGWHTAVLSVSATGYATVYLDGTQVYTESSGSAPNAAGTGTNLYVGGYTGSTVRNFTGNISNAAVIPVALTSTNVTTLNTAAYGTSYPTTVNSFSPIAYWQLADTTGSTTATDSGTHGYTGTVPTSVVTFGQTGNAAGSSVYGASTSFTATVVPQYTGGSVTPTGTVTFYSGGTAISTCTAASITGSSPYTATCTIASLAAGNNAITAIYTPGNSNFATSTSLPSRQTISQATSTTALSASPTPTTVGTSTTLTATITPQNSGGTPTGTVNFESNGSSISSCSAQAVSSGVATCTTTFAAGGTNSLTAIYSGDSSQTGSTSSAVPLTVNINTATSLTDSAGGLPIYGASDTVTSTVTGTVGTPVGTVGYTLDGSAYTGCTAQTLSSGTTSCTFASTDLTTGTHTVVATYTPSGGNFLASTSSSFTITVAPASSSTAISASPSSLTVVANPTTTLTSTITGSGATPTGTVTFTSTGSAPTCGSSGVVTLSSGTATCSYTPYASGTWTVTAQYSGDSGHAASSNTLSLTVANDYVYLPNQSNTTVSTTGTSSVTAPSTYSGWVISSESIGYTITGTNGANGNTRSTGAGSGGEAGTTTATATALGTVGATLSLSTGNFANGGTDNASSSPGYYNGGTGGKSSAIHDNTDGVYIGVAGGGAGGGSPGFYVATVQANGGAGAVGNASGCTAGSAGGSAGSGAGGGGGGGTGCGVSLAGAGGTTNWGTTSGGTTGYAGAGGNGAQGYSNDSTYHSSTGSGGGGGGGCSGGGGGGAGAYNGGTLYGAGGGGGGGGGCGGTSYSHATSGSGSINYYFNFTYVVTHN
jgi:hypothetical protein